MSVKNSALVFDRAQLRFQRNRAAEHFHQYDVLFQETAADLIERVCDVKRDFESVLDWGTHHGILAKYFSSSSTRFVVATDEAERMLHNLAEKEKSSSLVSDQEYVPFAPNSFDLVVSNLGLHWINDLPGALAQIKNTLRPDGLFLATALGGDTLQELRICLMDAELAVTGGISPRLSPTISPLAASELLQRAGFELPVVDQETYTFIYHDAFSLMRELRGMGQTNAHHHRLRQPTRRAVLLEAARLYQERFGQASGGITARYDVLFLHGWKAQ